MRSGSSRRASPFLPHHMSGSGHGCKAFNHHSVGVLHNLIFTPALNLHDDAEVTWWVQCRVVCMNCQRIMDRPTFQDQLSELNPGAYEAVERMVSTIRRNREAARQARQRGMTPDGVQRPRFDAEVQKTGGPTVSTLSCQHSTSDYSILLTPSTAGRVAP